MNLHDRGNLLNVIRAMPLPDSVELIDTDFVRGELAGLLAFASALVIYSQDYCYLDLSDGDRLALRQYVSNGGLLVLMGDWAQRVDVERVPEGYSCDLTRADRHDPRADAATYLLSTTFGWSSLQQATSSISPSFRTAYPFVRNDADVAGTVFEEGPAELSGEVTYYSGIRDTAAADAGGVPGARSLYQLSGSGGSSSSSSGAFAGVWSAPYDEGQVVYFGWDWRTSTWNAPKDGSAWSAVLQATLTLQVQQAQHQPPEQRAEPEPEPEPEEPELEPQQELQPQPQQPSLAPAAAAAAGTATTGPSAASPIVALRDPRSMNLHDRGNLLNVIRAMPLP